MDYSKIRVLMMQRNLSVNKLAKTLGLSPSGFSDTLNKQTMNVEVLEQISKLFEVPVSFFFEEGTIVKKKPCQDCIKYMANNELLRQLLSERDKEIRELYKELGRNLGTKGKESA